MIDWLNLVMNILWILGCSIILASISYASWDASSKNEKIRNILKKYHIQISINLGGFLFCAGLAGTTDVLWQRIIWIILGIGFLLQIWGEFRRRVKHGGSFK